MNKIITTIQSPVTWTALATWIVMNFSVISQLLPGAWLPIATALITIITVVFHVNKVNTLGDKVEALGGRR